MDRVVVYGSLIYWFAPISVISLIVQPQIPASTPVNPLPDRPPLVVKIVTVWPIWRLKLSSKNSPMVILLSMWPKKTHIH